ncbi:Serine/threonine-protein kinase RIO1 [Linum perenne]
MSAIVESSEHVEQHAGEEGEDDELSWSSDSEIADALDWLDAKDNGEAGEGSFALNSRRPNAHGGLHSRPSSSTLQPISNRNQKFTHHIRAAPLEEWEGRTNFGMSNTVTTAIRGSVRDMAIGKTRVTEKADRATVEQANVYHATKSNGQELAIKVCKTSVLVFKDRDRYVQGDYRFRFGYCKHNPRKMVKTWAEKELRNLLRLKAAGIRCPTTHLLRLHVLVMEFIGKDGWEAPRLKDASLSLDRLREGYMEKCKLVHGDLSEYNILYYEGHLYIIDVSQSVDLDHPRALDFLREDCVHVSDFFKKHGVAVMNIRELFDFIVDPSITDDSIDNYLEEVQKRITSREVTVEDEIADSVFVQAYIPKRLDSVKDAEEDVIRLTSGQKTDDLYYKVITGLTDPKNEPQEKGKPGEESLVNKESDDDDNFSDSDSDDESSCRSDTTEIESRDDLKAARKENKKKVKEEKRESRKTKVPKALKKRKKKLSKAKKTR